MTGYVYNDREYRFAAPNVLVVGPDRVGKTTIVKHLSKLLGIEAFKCPAEKDIFLKMGDNSHLTLWFDKMLAHFLMQTGYRFISDRAYPCEFVYSQVFGRKFDHEMFGETEWIHSQIGTVILYLYSSKQPVEPDDIVPSDRYWDVVRKYDEFCEQTPVRVVKFDTSRMLDAFGDGTDISEEIAQECLKLIQG